MSSFNVSRILTDASHRDLAAQLYGGQVLKSFRQTNVFANLLGGMIDHKVVQAKQFTYPIIAEDPIPEYTVGGDERLGQVQGFKSIPVTIDDMLITDRSIPDDQFLISHYDPIAPMTDSMGQALANDLDTKIAIMSLTGARTAALSGYHYGGTRVLRVAANLATAYPATPLGADAFINDLSIAGQVMDEKHIPRMGRVAVVSPYMMRVLERWSGWTVGTPANTFATMMPLFSSDYGTQNDLLSRTIQMVQGFAIVVSNNLPQADYTASDIASATVNSGASTTGSTTTFTGANTNNRAALDSPTNTTKYKINASVAATASGGQPAALLYAMNGDGQPGLAMLEAPGGVTTDIERPIRHNAVYMRSRNFFGLGVVRPDKLGSIEVVSS